MIGTFVRMAMLTAECQQVIALRMMKAAMGGAAAVEEASLMLSEKTEAAISHGSAFLAGGSLDDMVREYREIVQANALRLTGA